MTKNKLFLISAGCLFILLSSMMERPVYLICTGLFLIITAAVLSRKGGTRQQPVKKS